MYAPALLAVALSVLAFISCFSSSEQRKWDGLRVTWSRDPTSPSAFASLPRTERDAVSQGFRKFSDSCNNERGPFLGRRYVRGNDFSVVLLYDVNGYIAGMQAGIERGQPNGYPWTGIQPPFIAEGKYFFITAYFVQPGTICKGGRSSDMFAKEGTGLDLYIQNGSSPLRKSILIPKQESQMQQTTWTKGKCFPTMGVHYWHDLSRDMDCNFFFPVFLLYNGGELTAFGWAFGANLASERYEHPPQQAISMFFDVVPTCLTKMGPLSTMHIYLTDNPTQNKC